MVCPIGTEVRGVKIRTGFMAAPETPPEVIEFKVIPVIARESLPAVNVVSTLVESAKPPGTALRAPPRVSPVSVIVMAAMPVATTPVVSTIVVLVAVAAGVEVAVKVATLLAMEVTDPKK